MGFWWGMACETLLGVAVAVLLMGYGFLVLVVVGCWLRGGGVGGGISGGGGGGVCGGGVCWPDGGGRR